MEDLIKALKVFLKYSKKELPTCHYKDSLIVLVDPSIVSKEDIVILESLDFHIEENNDNFGDCFISYRF